MLWKKIKGYPGYEVSNHGQIRSYWKACRHKYLCKKPQRILKPSLIGQPYHKKLNVRLCNDEGISNGLIHQLVLKAFGPPKPHNKPLVLHKDDNPINNHIDNLYWGDRSDNAYDSIKNKTWGDRRGEKSGTAKLTAKDVVEIRKLFSEGISAKKLGDKYKINSDHIYRIVNKTRWSHIK